MAIGDISFYGTFVEGTSNKFYSIHHDGNIVVKHWGRRGSEGQTQEIVCPTVAAARDLVRKTGNVKLAKGYTGNFFQEIPDIPKCGETREAFLARIGTDLGE